jgi:hypothetical protein
MATGTPERVSYRIPPIGRLTVTTTSDREAIWALSPMS